MTETEKILLNLKTLREDRALSQECLALRLGVNRTTYARKEKGEIPITTDEWVILGQVLSTDVTSFFDSSKRVTPDFPPPIEEERVLLALYRSLDIEEKTDLISSIRLLLKRITRKKVKQTLEELAP